MEDEYVGEEERKKRAGELLEMLRKYEEEKKKEKKPGPVENENVPSTTEEKRSRVPPLWGISWSSPFRHKD